jgi:FkbM family methyltransferase
VPNIKTGVIFDVGANVGNYAKKLRTSNLEATIFCFEPHPVNFDKLHQNMANLNIKMLNVGVGSAEGKLKLYDYADEDGSSHASLYKDVIETIHKRRSVEHEVEVIALDDFVVKNGIDRVNLLKIDTEGHEMSVLRGFERFIKSGKVDLIHFEFNEMNIASRIFFKDFWDFLPNYDFYRMLPDGLVPIKNYNPLYCEIFTYQNIVAKLRTPSKFNP